MIKCEGLTVKLRIEPIRLPSSYRDNLDNVASSTDTSLVISPWVIASDVRSIRSSILVWYWC